MGDLPSPVGLATPLAIHTMSIESPAAELRTLGGGLGGGTSLAWPAANRAIYVPFTLGYPYPVQRVFWVLGSSPSGVTSMDMGIYTADGARIYSTGSTAQSGLSSATQYVTPSSPILLAPGGYWFALACSDTSASRINGMSTTPVAYRMIGCLTESSALPLPASMTPVTMADSFYPHFGVTRTASGF